MVRMKEKYLQWLEEKTEVFSMVTKEEKVFTLATKEGEVFYAVNRVN